MGNNTIDELHIYNIITSTGKVQKDIGFETLIGQRSIKACAEDRLI